MLNLLRLYAYACLLAGVGLKHPVPFHLLCGADEHILSAIGEPAPNILNQGVLASSRSRAVSWSSHVRASCARPPARIGAVRGPCIKAALTALTSPFSGEQTAACTTIYL